MLPHPRAFVRSIIGRANLPTLILGCTGGLAGAMLAILVRRSIILLVLKRQLLTRWTSEEVGHGVIGKALDLGFVEPVHGNPRCNATLLEKGEVRVAGIGQRLLEPQVVSGSRRRCC